MATKRIQNHRQLIRSIGDNITLHMQHQGLTWRETAERVEVSTNTVGRWARGESECGMLNLTRLCRLFKCRLHDLVPDAGS